MSASRIPCEPSWRGAPARGLHAQGNEFHFWPSCLASSQSSSPSTSRRRRTIFKHDGIGWECGIVFIRPCSSFSASRPGTGPSASTSACSAFKPTGGVVDFDSHTWATIIPWTTAIEVPKTVSDAITLDGASSGDSQCWGGSKKVTENLWHGMVNAGRPVGK